MTQENKELLLKDLCARFPYGIKVKSIPIEGYSEGFIGEVAFCSIKREQFGLLTEYGELVVNLSCDIVKPYLRPMSSITEEERKELNNQGYAKIAGELYHYCALSSNNAFYNPERHPYVRIEYVIKLIDWLNAHHFDYRGLIPMNLALEAPEGMYNINEK